MDDVRAANDQDEDVAEYLIAHWWRRIEVLSAEVGDVEVLTRLQPESLPDEAFDLSAVDATARDRVAALVQLCDEACETLFDVEHRTACRRLLARVATANPSIVSGRRDERRLAAAVVYSVAAANRSVGPGRAVLVRDLLGHFGVRGRVSDLATTLMASTTSTDGGAVDPTRRGSAALLTRAGGERIVAERDEALVWVRAVATELASS